MAPKFDRRGLIRFGLGSAAAALPVAGAVPPFRPGWAFADSPRPVAHVASGALVLHGHAHGGDRVERESNVRINLFVYRDGSAQLRVFTPPIDEDTRATATVRLPIGVGEALRAALFGEAVA